MNFVKTFSMTFVGLLMTVHSNAYDFTLPKGKGPQCIFAVKDYSAPGVSLPKREGFYITGTIGCVYLCNCGGDTTYRVTAPYSEKHFDLNFGSGTETGGPNRAKWFICPHSIDESTWKEIRNEYGELLGYDVEPDKTPFSVYGFGRPTLSNWAKNTCH